MSKANVIAEKLNLSTREMGISEEVIKEAKEKGVAIAYGESDDLLEFRGAIYDEISVYDGGVAYVNKEGLVTNECDEEYCPHYAKLVEKASTVHAIWCPEKDGEIVCSWEITADIPHHKFNIMEDGELFCIGIVFALSDAKQLTTLVSNIEIYQS